MNRSAPDEAGARPDSAPPPAPRRPRLVLHWALFGVLAAGISALDLWSKEAIFGILRVDVVNWKSLPDWISELPLARIRDEQIRRSGAASVEAPAEKAIAAAIRKLLSYGYSRALSRPVGQSILGPLSRESRDILAAAQAAEPGVTEDEARQARETIRSAPMAGMVWETLPDLVSNVPLAGIHRSRLLALEAEGMRPEAKAEMTAIQRLLSSSYSLALASPQGKSIVESLDPSYRKFLDSVRSSFPQVTEAEARAARRSLRPILFSDPPIPIIPDFFEIEASVNTGAFSGWFSGKMTFLTVLSAVALVAIVWFLWSQLRGAGPHRLATTAAFGLLWAGAFGNLYDRGLLGYVRDFVKWFVVIGGRPRVWPNFNVADSAICVGVGLILLLFLLEARTKPAVTAGKDAGGGGRK